VGRSTDGGAGWSASNSGLYPIHDDVYHLAIDPDNPSTLYAGTASDGIYGTTDGGAQWTFFGMSNRSIRALTVDPVDATSVFVCAQGYGISRPATAALAGVRSTEVLAVMSLSFSRVFMEERALRPSALLRRLRLPPLLRLQRRAVPPGSSSWADTPLDNVVELYQAATAPRPAP
jgi:hypothetical protein